MLNVCIFIIVAMLIWATYTDMKVRLVPDAASVVIALTAFVAMGIGSITGADATWIPTIPRMITGLISGVGLLMLTESLTTFKSNLRIRHNDQTDVRDESRGAIGGGDVKLVAALSLWLGPAILVVLLLASLGAVLFAWFVSHPLVVDRAETFSQTKIAYVPFITLGVIPLFISLWWLP